MGGKPVQFNVERDAVRPLPLASLGRRQGNHPGIGAAELEGAPIGAIDGIAWGEAAPSVFACHLAGLDALGLEFAVACWHQQGAGACHPHLGQAGLAGH